MGKIVKKPLERRAEIIGAARVLFQQKEYHRATLQDVMNILGVAKGTIYHYFQSKEELLEAVVQEMVNEYIQQMQILLKTADGNALHKMQLLIEKGMKRSSDPILEEIHKKGNEVLHTRLLAETIIKLAPLYAELIEQGCREKIFQTDSSRECAEFILSAIQFLTDSGIFPWQQVDLERRILAFPHLIESLLQAPKGSFEFLIPLFSMKN